MVKSDMKCIFGKGTERANVDSLRLTNDPDCDSFDSSMQYLDDDSGEVTRTCTAYNC